MVLFLKMKEAILLHKSPYPADIRDATEKIWDAFERIKSEKGIEPEYPTTPKDTSNEDIDVEDVQTDTCSNGRTSGQDSKTINQS